MCMSVYVDVWNSNGKQSLKALGLNYLEMFESSFRVRLDTTYFAENYENAVCGDQTHDHVDKSHVFYH